MAFTIQSKLFDKDGGYHLFTSSNDEVGDLLALHAGFLEAAKADGRYLAGVKGLGTGEKAYVITRAVVGMTKNEDRMLKCYTAGGYGHKYAAGVLYDNGDGSGGFGDANQFFSEDLYEVAPNYGEPPLGDSPQFGRMCLNASTPFTIVMKIQKDEATGEPVLNQNGNPRYRFERIDGVDATPRTAQRGSGSSRPPATSSQAYKAPPRGHWAVADIKAVVASKVRNAKANGMKVNDARAKVSATLQAVVNHEDIEGAILSQLFNATAVARLSLAQCVALDAWLNSDSAAVKREVALFAVFATSDNGNIVASDDEEIPF